MSPTAPVRVVHLVGQLGRGGTERQLYLTLKHLDPTRVRSSVVVFNPSPHAVYDEPLRRLGITVHAVPRERRSAWRRIPWLRRVIAADRAEIVHSWTVHDNPYAAVCGRLGGAPVRWGSLRGSPDSPALSGLPRPLRWLTLAAPQRLVVNSTQIARQLEARGYPTRKVIVLPNCIESDPTDVEPTDPPDLPFDETTPLVASIGNLRSVKNHPMFVRAMATVLARRPDAAALIVGQSLPSEPDLPPRLAEQIEAAGLSNRLVLVGFRDDVAAILGRLSVLCLTSRTEGTPNVLLEAMVTGCPVVATAVGGIPDLVRHGETGLLVESDDAEGLAAAVGELLDDPDRAARLARAARRAVITTHGCGTIADRLASLYEDALDGRHDRGAP